MLPPVIFRPKVSEPTARFRFESAKRITEAFASVTPGATVTSAVVRLRSKCAAPLSRPPMFRPVRSPETSSVLPESDTPDPFTSPQLA